MEEYRHLYTEREWNRMLRKLEKDPNTKAWIYVIEDETNKSITCYVGKTEDKKERLRCYKKDKSKTHRNGFVRSLDKIELKILEEIPLLQWAEAERFYIAYFRSMGMKLANATDGGDASPNPGYMTEEQKEHLRKVNTGKRRSEASKKKQGESTSGEKNHFYGKRHSQETRNRLSQTRLGRSTLPPEEIQKRSEKWTGEGNPKYNHQVDNEYIINAYLSGKRMVEIAREIGVSRQFVYRRIKAFKKEQERNMAYGA